MGSVEMEDDRLIIYSHVLVYGNEGNAEVAWNIREEIETCWNEPGYQLTIKGRLFTVEFIITAAHHPTLTPEEVYQNLDPRNNYFRVEKFAYGNISFVDGVGCNTGYFLLENLYKGSTTAAHEYGHTIGLKHPSDLDIRGKGQPGIMYPRGTLVESMFQYEPDKPAASKGGTLHPMHRRVRKEDIAALRLEKLNYVKGQATIGEFTSIWHDAQLPYMEA